MCNNFKTNQNEEIKSEGILIFKDTMEYLVDGILTAEQYAELTRMIYATRWGDGVNEKEIKDKLLLGIWKTLKHTIKKSARNARYRENNQNKKSALQEVTSTEFDIPKIDENAENENKADLIHFNPQDDNQYQTEGQMPSNGLKIAKEEDINEIPCTEQEVEYDNYEEVVYDVLESEDGDIIRNILDRSIDYQYFDKTEYEYAYTNGNNHIKEIISKYDFTPKAHKDFETYCIKHSTSYYNYVQENLSMNYNMTA